MLLKILGALVAVWLVFLVIGFVFKAVLTLVIIGAVVTVAAVGYNAIKGASSRRQIR